MDWLSWTWWESERVSALGQLLAAVATIVGLFLIFLQVKAAKDSLKAAEGSLGGQLRQLKAQQQQMEQQTKYTRADFLLRFDDAVYRHDGTHRKLRKGADWTKQGAGPKGHKDNEDVTQYLGLWERAYRLVQNGVLEIEDVDHLYGRRLESLLRHGGIRDTWGILKEQPGWKDFDSLIEKIDASPAKRRKESLVDVPDDLP
jgi:hypothetical protein